MSGTMTRLEFIGAARKRHRCDWCWQAIEIGRPYRRYRVFAQGEASTVREHPECYEAMCEAAEEEGGWIEWTPGQERPPQEMSR